MRTALLLERYGEGYDPHGDRERDGKVAGVLKYLAEAEDIVVQLSISGRLEELMQILKHYAVVGPLLVRVLSEAKGGTSKLSSAA